MPDSTTNSEPCVTYHANIEAALNYCEGSGCDANLQRMEILPNHQKDINPEINTAKAVICQKF